VSNPVRVVLDTNILLSACLKPDGNEAQVIALVQSGAIIACVSPAIEAEYGDVPFRPKFAAMQEQATRLIAALEPRFFRVDPQFTLALATDEDDNRFLECAQEATAAFLITGNLRHYPPVHGPTAIVNSRNFLDRLTNQLY
jgi:uncharacterized protein